MRGKGGPTTLAALAAGALLLAAAVPAGATITAPTSVLAGVQAADSASFNPTSAFNIGSTPNGTPLGVADTKSPRPPFPRDGSTFLVLSTGNATLADQPDQPGVFPSVDDGGGLVRDRGDSALDVTALQVNFQSPVPVPGAGPVPACLSFDFRFLSEEYPARLTSPYTDAFIAELDPSPVWTTSGATISAPNTFTFGPNLPVTIKSALLSPSEAAGTPYGAATAPLHAQILVPVGTGNHQLYLSVFDQNDRIYDSAVFIDNIGLATPPGTCASGVTSLGPALAITGPTIGATVNNATPTLTGTAGNATGDAATVNVRIYGGGVPAGTPVQTLAVQRTGTSWSAITQPLVPGQYTAQATQANGQINGVSAPTTFTVPQPQPEPQGQPSQVVGDRDHDGIPDDVDTSDGSLPPVPGKSFDARVVSGQVFIKYPAGTGPRAVSPPKGFVPLKGAANVPMGAQLDTRGGRVAVTSAADTGAVKTQTSDFYQGIFEVKQSVPKKKPKKPAALITNLVLKGEISRSQCAPLKGAAAAAAKKKKGPKSVLGKLWGNGKGKFRTTGKYSSATVRGTIWLTQDRCDGTLTTVKRGIVSVQDFKRKKTVSVKAGHSYLARAQRAATKSGRRAK